MSSITGGARAPRLPSGTDLASLGPSDNSDSGSDSLGGRDREALASDSDAEGTGEGASVGGLWPGDGFQTPGADILPDHLVGPLAGAPDAPGSALDDPNLIDTSADVADLAQPQPDAQDLDGFSAPEAQTRSAADRLPGHRGVQ